MALFNDSPSYIELADAIRDGRLVTSYRTPVYPGLIAASQIVASGLGADWPGVLMAIQILLVSGVSTFLMYDLGRRLTSSSLVGVLAAAIYASDADLQHFSSSVMPEALAVFLLIASVWLRVRDDDWKFAGWPLAVLILTRPNLICIPPVLAACEVLRRKAIWPATHVLVPLVGVGGVWTFLSLIAGTDPLAPQKRFGPLHSFGTVYVSNLWLDLPESEEKAAISRAKAAGQDVYEAASSLEREFGTEGLSRVGAMSRHASPLAYVKEIVKVLPQEIRQSSFWVTRPFSPALQSVVSVIEAWRRPYRFLLYRSLIAFTAVLLIGAFLGFGWNAALPTYRWLVLPLVLTILLSTSVMSLATEGVGRLALPMHPLHALACGMAIARLFVLAAGRLYPRY